MPKFILETKINASKEICFDLARDLDFHQKSMESSGEKAIAGKTSGLIELNETVTWEATHFGIKQKLTSKITEFDYPNYFVDQMIAGAFKSFKHQHIFEETKNSTLMTDIFEFESPYGFIGKLANLVVKPYMTRLLSERNHLLKFEAERRAKEI